MQCAWLVVVVVVAAVSGQLLSLAPEVSECNTPWSDCGEPSRIAIHTSQGIRPQDSQTLAANLDGGSKRGSARLYMYLQAVPETPCALRPT